MNDLLPRPTIAIIGLGYVGLPLAVEFGIVGLSPGYYSRWATH